MLCSMACCSCCLPAARALGLLPSASREKNDYLTCTTAQVAIVLADDPRGDRAPRPCGEGGAIARKEAPVCLGVPRLQRNMVGVCAY